MKARSTLRGGFCMMLSCASVFATSAQTVQKCQDPGGQVRYQSAPCARGERTVESWPAIPDDPILVTAAASTRLPGKPRRARSSGRPQPQPVLLAGNGAQTCAEAKAYRDAVERRVGLARTYELLTALSRHVHDACR